MKLALALFASLIASTVAQADEAGVSLNGKFYTVVDFNNDGVVDAVYLGNDKNAMILGGRELIGPLVDQALKHEPAAKKGDRIGTTIVTSNK